MERFDLPERYYPDRAVKERRCAPHERFNLFELEGAGCVRHFWISPGLGAQAGRNIILRIYFDGEAVPSVESPLADFFGVMHGVQWYPVNTEYIAVLEKVGYNCYFPMPFSDGARFELEIGDDPAFLCAMADWRRYEEPVAEKRRFRARWRHENPTESYGGEYLMLDADGPGELLGFFYGVRLIDNEDRWSHGGAENIYLDGETEHPSYIRGVGGEDTFGTAFGGALHAPDTRMYCGMPYYVHEDTGEARPAQRVVGYRFYDKDALPFRRSVHMRFGCMRNDICSTVYWYSEKGVREFFRLPPANGLKCGAKCGKECGLPLPQSGSWRVFGPVPAAEGIDPAEFLRKLPEELPLHTGNVYGADGRTGAVWLPAECVHGFLDFRWFFRVHRRGVSPTEEGFAVACCDLFSERGGETELLFTYDDKLYFDLGEGVVGLPEHRAFRSERVTITLKKGNNPLKIALMNTVGFNHGGWCFAMRAVCGGEELSPKGKK